MPKRKAAGLTLLEALVILVVVVFLLGLALMYLSRSREQPRRMFCANRQQQVGQAIIVSADTHRQYAGYRNRLEPSERCVSWVVTTFPFLERQELYTAWSAAGEAQPAAPMIDVFICPSTDRSSLTEGPFSSYLANAGRADKDELTAGIFFDHCLPANERVVITPNYVAEHDGTDRTLLLAERRTPFDWSELSPEKTTVGFVWYADTPPAEPAYPSSYHVGGFNVIFADGHGEFLNDEIDPRVYQQLMTTHTPAE